MNDPNRKRLRRATIVYWVLLLYIIAALVWWFLSLQQQGREMYELRKQELADHHPPGTPKYIEETEKIEKERSRATTKYLSEGITFLALIIIGAAYIYRLVRKQFLVQLQQQNFVMAITHELKTPIAVSRLNLETLQKHRLDEERTSKLVQRTLQETLRLDTLINNILISAQLEGESYKMTRDELNFSHLVEDVASEFSSRYPSRDLVKDIPPDVELNGDPLLLKLMVSNLLENANKYSPKGSPVSLRLRREEKGVEMQVADEGPGISDSEKKNIFEKFYRIGNEQTRTTQGTGLGLYLCRKIIKDHNGEIGVRDNQPSGSIFIVRFW
ncbi:MAG TPA: ATP-binding protein [Flavisolibacter sp.]|jgi:signal transduction histidine kinase